MRGYTLPLLITLPFFAFTAPLVEIASPKASSYLSFLKKSFSQAKLNIVVYPKYRSPHISVNGSFLSSLNAEERAKVDLKKKIEKAFQQEKSTKIGFDSLSINHKNKGFFFSFAPCNYGKTDFRGRWVAFVTEEDGRLLHRAEGRLEIPSGACGRPINFNWLGKHKSSKLVFIVALFDEKGKYIISKSNLETEAKGK